MGAVESVKFTLTRQGDPVVLDKDLGLKFVEAEGAYQAPDAVHARAKVDFGGNLLELELLWLPEGNYMSNPLTGTFGEMPANITLNPLALFDASVGIPHILREGVQEPEDLGLESLEESQTRHLSGVVEAAAFQAFTPVTSEASVPLDLWLDVTTDRIVRVQMTEQSGDVNSIDFFDYNQPVTIPEP
jgi:hypothetical protein